MPRQVAAIVVLLLALGLIAGCGGDVTYHRGAAGVVSVRIEEYRIVPQAIEIKAGRVRLRAINRGRLNHNVVIEERDPEPGEEAIVYGRTPTLRPGQRGRERASFRLKPGSYRISCSIGNHDSLGEYGELKVVP